MSGEYQRSPQPVTVAVSPSELTAAVVGDLVADPEDPAQLHAAR
jgi:hypothetical protein